MILSHTESVSTGKITASLPLSSVFYISKFLPLVQQFTAPDGGQGGLFGNGREDFGRGGHFGGSTGDFS